MNYFLHNLLLPKFTHTFMEFPACMYFFGKFPVLYIAQVYCIFMCCTKLFLIHDCTRFLNLSFIHLYNSRWLNMSTSICYLIVLYTLKKYLFLHVFFNIYSFIFVIYNALYQQVFLHTLCIFDNKIVKPMIYHKNE